MAVPGMGLRLGLEGWGEGQAEETVPSRDFHPSFLVPPPHATKQPVQTEGANLNLLVPAHNSTHTSLFISLFRPRRLEVAIYVSKHKGIIFIFQRSENKVGNNYQGATFPSSTPAHPRPSASIFSVPMSHLLRSSYSSLKTRNGSRSRAKVRG